MDEKVHRLGTNGLLSTTGGFLNIGPQCVTLMPLCRLHHFVLVVLSTMDQNC